MFIHHALSGTPIEIWGDGTIVRDYVHVSDVARAFLRALDYAGSSRVFNIASGQGRTLSDIVALIRTLSSRPVDVRHRAPRPFDVPSNVLDIARARAELNWTPTIAFEDGVRETFEWALSQRNG